jgi:hypothetical protein
MQISVITAVETYDSGDSVLGSLQPAGASWINGLLRSDGTELSLDPPPLSGSGILSLRSFYTMYLVNTGNTVALVRHGIGVSNPVNSNKPMYPYLGVSHGQQDSLSAFESLKPLEIRKVCGLRWDTVDEALQSDQPIPGWPNWKLVNGPSGKPPQLVLCAANDTPAVTVMYRNVQFEQVAYWGMKLTRKF